MAREFEIIGAGALGALLQRKARHAPEPGSVCANCDAVLAGPYCHDCGQDADNHHRSITHLTWEGIEGLTHLDGRLAQTLPLLFFQPGRLARDHLDGRRARHVPPFRMFLISLLIFMTVLEASFQIRAEQQTRQEASAVAASESVDSGGRPVTGLYADPQKALQDAAVAEAQAQQDSAQPPRPVAHGAGGGFSAWLRDHMKRAEANQDYYKLVLFTWAHRLAILLLPILAGLLAGLYARRRQFFVYDHLIVAMQFLSFQFLLFAVAWLVPGPLRILSLALAVLWTPVNLYQVLRGAYGSSRITAGIRTLFLWTATLALFGILVLVLMAVALAQM
jgi:hypothetical protein